ncbi:hypothetical protein AJ79_00437 [Helicocarpus griseus UAMH5409]|uniref:Non-reducing polyketide synthase nscA n=1 Tax=Helicocarpus griseus UAMH5409 TaxID=1447875 RepID=A0A2B7YBF0_9EURO|nr:hypothetical protein AJ79_00437 [Helicocarpus griseus UAMH5409]
MQVSDDIAVVGFAYKLPEDIENDAAFWEILQSARNLATDWPENRSATVRPEAHPDPKNGTNHSRGGHFIREDQTGFDAPFFGITAKEAASMDPMQRWTLEVSYRAFENAGIPSETLKGSRTAVLSATWTEDYIRMAAMDPDNYDRTSATGCMASIIPNRVSYLFGMQGPSMHVDTACSSGLSAFDLACKLIASGDADAALVTGANLILEPGVYRMLRNLQMLSPDSTCKSFDRKANGFARGEGVLGFVLKPISTALKDGDVIRAVVRAVASNQDGHTPSLSQPNPVAQEKLIRYVYAQAGLGMEQTRYVEAHGTGTPVGDPIEMKAIGNAFRDARNEEEPLYVGSVKSNIGHLEGASGLAGLLKAILILEKGIIPPNALFKELNPDIDAEFLRVHVPSRCTTWPSTGIRRVSVNSFGFGGSNTHVILEDALHFLEYRGLQGKHCTTDISAIAKTTNGRPTQEARLPKTSGQPNGIPVASPITEKLGNGAALTNGTLTPIERTEVNKKVNGIDGPIPILQKLENGAALTNGASMQGNLVQVNGTAHDMVKPITNGTFHFLHEAETQNYYKLLVFSAFDEKSIQRTLQSYTSWYEANEVFSDGEKLNSLAYTLAMRRSHMRWRSFAIASALEEELEFDQKNIPQPFLKALLPASPVRVGSDPGLCWVFTGQGTNYVDMGWELVAMYAVFRETLEKIDNVYKGLGCEWSIFDKLRQGRSINNPEYSQPLSTAIQIALIELLRRFGVAPKAVVGHSSGEIAAAYAIGALSLASACKVAYFRGHVAGELRNCNTSSPGAMISINLAPDQVLDFLSKIKEIKGVGIACVNSPLNVTLSGPEAYIDAINVQANQDGIFALKLKTRVAYHSPAMRSVAAEYLSLMGSLEPSRLLPIPMFSTVTGKALGPAELATGQYWVDNMVSPVIFATAVKLMASKTMNLGITDWVEVGPHPALRRYVQDTLGKDRIYYSTALQRSHSAAQKVMELAGTLFCRGYDISLTAVNNQEGKEMGSIPLLVDCPPYPFDHSNKFWAENRISRDYRLRMPTKGGVLGQRVPDWNPLQPRWRSFLSIETHPWIGHHVVGDMALYPAAGMLICAFEAAQEMIPDGKMIAGFYVKEAHFLNPVVVPESWDDRVEMVVSLQPAKSCPQNRQASSSLFDISIFTYMKESHTWTEAFRSSLKVQYVSDAGDSERYTADEATRELYQRAQESCVLPIDPQVLYSDASKHGLQYGELFKLCKNIKWDKSGAQAIATVPVPHNEKDETVSFVHPAVLDTMFHALRVSAGQQQAANVPLRLADAWFASAGWQNLGTETVHWLASSKGKRDNAARGERGSVCALTNNGKVLARVGKMVTTAVSRDDSDAIAESGEVEQKTLLYGIEWEPQLSLLSAGQLAEVCKANYFPCDGETVLSDYYKRTAMLNTVAVRHVKNTSKEQRAKLDSTLRQHMDWMEHYANSLPHETREAAEALTDTEYETQIDAFTAAFPSWTLYSAVARALPAIMAGEVDPLQIIFESEHAKTFYTSLFNQVCGDGRLHRFLELAAHENPSLRILEVGAGTGGMTVHIINALREREKRTGAISFTEYMYTDISPAFFESARAMWDMDGTRDRMFFKPLDMEHPVSDQGFVENTYDLLIAGCCVHATRLLSKTLQNLRRLLKPGGKIILLELTNGSDITSCFFATLASGWWLSQEEARVKNMSPLVSLDKWDEVLKQNGFSGNDLVLRDTPEAKAHIVSIIVSTAINETEAEIPVISPRRMFIVNPEQNSQKILAGALCEGQDMVIPLDQVDHTFIGNDDIVISLVEVDNALLADLPEKHFYQLQTIFKQARILVWVTAPKDGVNDAHFPHYSVAQGFLRTVRAEMPDSYIVSLDIEDVASIETRIQVIDKTIKAAYDPSSYPELEYVFRSGQMHTARAIENIAANRTLQSTLYPRLQNLAWKDSPAVKLALTTPGSLESLRFEQDENYEDLLNPNDIEIEAKAWGLSRMDVLSALGRVDDGYDVHDFGPDCSGVVTRVGESCDPLGPKPGDRVIMLSRGCLRKFPRAHETAVVKIPSQQSLKSYDVAAAVLEPALTAYRALIDVARVEQGDKVLVHEASSARGQIAVQIARLKGAEVLVTTQGASLEEEDEKQTLFDNMGIVPENIFSASGNTTSYIDWVKRATDGYGVDVVINTLTGDQLQESCGLLGPGGRFVDISVGGCTQFPGAEARLKNASFAAVNVLDLPQRVIARLLKDTITLLEKGEITPPTPVRVFPATEMKEAFRAIQNGEGSGRVVLVPQPNDIVSQLVIDQSTVRRCKLDENASYLIPGGLGGLGRSILSWMVTCGAKHLIVPSRSGASAPAAAKLVSSLSSRGVHIVTPRCNAANIDELAILLEDTKQTMPPIRGVINCAMVLPNAVFANMSFQQWSTAVNTKVAISFNLHRLLPDTHNLDFFIHLSSLAGINGQIASSNYAAGCSFQDALARRYPGVVTLDIGWMSDIGLIAETAAYQRQLQDWDNMQRIEEKELLGILGTVCNAKHVSKENRTTEQQLLIGLRTPASFLSRNQGPLPPVLDRPFLSTFAQSVNSIKSASRAKNIKASQGKAEVIDHGMLFRASIDDKARASAVTSALAEKLARATMMSADDVDPDRTLSAYGIDSLMAIDIRNWLNREFCAKLGIWEVMGGERPIKMIAETVVAKSTAMKV